MSQLFLMLLRFALQSSTRECMIYGYYALGYTTEAILNFDCHNFPSEVTATSTRKWYWVLEDEGSSVTSCADIQDADPASTSIRVLEQC